VVNAVQHSKPRSEPEPAAATEAEPEAQPKPRRAASSSEPVLERVVVTTSSTQAAGTEAEGAKPTRRGWWQKKLGLE